MIEEGDAANAQSQRIAVRRESTENKAVGTDIFKGSLQVTRESEVSRRSQLRRDDGSSAIELVLLTPALIALVFALVQTALVWNAQHTVGAAAQHGARLARAATALEPALQLVGSNVAVADSDAQVEQSTLRFLQHTGGKALQDPTVTIRRDGQYVTVTVTGTSIGVLPGTTVRVSGQSRSPLEGFRHDG